MYACLCEAVCDVTTVPSHLKTGPAHVKGKPSIENVTLFFCKHASNCTGHLTCESGRISPYIDDVGLDF